MFPMYTVGLPILPTGGAFESSPLMGPRPVPHKMTQSPGWNVLMMLLDT